MSQMSVEEFNCLRIWAWNSPYELCYGQGREPWGSRYIQKATIGLVSGERSVVFFFPEGVATLALFRARGDYRDPMQYAECVGVGPELRDRVYRWLLQGLKPEGF